ncbi:ATP-grasp domain-containing protein [Shouchella clausii]|uniref:ATP-grasp domain-containing protein n=1 Tax=Shouchella clausii TaxID=79880 RepID=UPI000921A73A|nr:ATP-grasp domain-containing protein [Shouchella clausii]MDO7266694.1 ATP-grasp domain-containing protein [Shouchella clausii]MEB5474377.1 ATP-grasp domain-containing protein [Shouchella clausii]WQG94754.1 ATP-grasp domain-containing protein [Shouchella clausii]SHL32595.1 ATP-grasp domain-containing protein [Shouchella rhizosphaerae]
MINLNKKVLILGVAAVQRDAIVELKNQGHEVHACAMAKDGPGADAADYFTKINILDEEAIINYVKNNSIDLVYSVGSDIAIPIASSISEKLNLPYFVTKQTALICNNKDLMRSTLGSDFYGNVKFQVIESEIDDKEIILEYPFILKPTDSQGQRGVFLIKTYEDFKKNYLEARKYSRSGRVIIEQYISGPEISVNGYIVNGEVKFLISSDRETWPEYTGLIKKHVVPSQKVSNKLQKNIFEIASKACEKLGILNGPFYLQMKMDNDLPYIIEITPRLDGCHMWKLLKYYSEINLIKLTFNHFCTNDTTELSKITYTKKSKLTLEFACQIPNTKVNYDNFAKNTSSILDSYKYYPENSVVRPINGVFEKIGYFIH